MRKEIYEKPQCEVIFIEQQKNICVTSVMMCEDFVDDDAESGNVEIKIIRRGLN